MVRNICRGQQFWKISLNSLRLLVVGQGLPVLAQRLRLLRGNALRRRICIYRIVRLPELRSALEALTLVAPEMVNLLALWTRHAERAVILTHLALRGVLRVYLPEKTTGQEHSVLVAQQPLQSTLKTRALLVAELQRAARHGVVRFQELFS